MKEDRSRDLIFVLYLSVIFVLAVVYFTAPERAGLLNNALEWWSEAADILL